MTQTPTTQNASVLTRRRADALADRLEQGAKALTDFAASLTDAQWKTRCMPDGRTVGVIVHHVGFVYPIEIDISRPLAKGEPLTGVTMDDVHAMNAKHAAESRSSSRRPRDTSAGTPRCRNASSSSRDTRS